MRHIVKTFIVRQTSNLALKSIMHFSSSKKEKPTEELERRMKEESERRIKQELQRRKRQEEDRIKRQEEDRIKRQEEERRKKQEEDRRKKQEEDRIKRQEEDRRKKQEEDRIKRQEEDRIKRQEEDRRKKQEEDRRKKQEEDRRKRQEEDRRKRQEEDMRKRQEEDRRKKQEEGMRKRQEEDRRKKQEEDRRKRQEEDMRKRQEEDMRKRQEEDRRMKEESERRKRQEEDRRKRQEEDRRMKEESERRKRQEQNKQKSNSSYKFKTIFDNVTNIIPMLALTFSMFATYIAYLSYKAPKEPVQIQKQKEAFQKYGEKQVFLIDKDYIQESFVEKQMKYLFDDREENHIKFVVGCPGIGKTSAIQKIIRDQRNKGVKCFYINLRDVTTQGTAQSVQQLVVVELNTLISAIQKCLPQEIKQQKNKVKFIIDDINMLQVLNDERLFTEMSFLYNLRNLQYLDVTFISSSSGFSSRLQTRSGFSKSAQLLIVQDPQKEKQQFLKQILQKQGSSLNLNQSVKDYLLEHFTLPRSLIKQIKKLQKEQHKEKTNQQRLQFLKSSFQKQKQKQNNIITDAFQQLTNKKIAALLGFKLLKQQQILNEVGCQKIQNSTNKSFPGHMKYIKKAVNILDDNNMLIFCRPRQRVHRQAIREFLMENYPEELKDISEPQRNE